ncbi:hypothetical protein [Comamonas composti]|uniref:hypothetical protein n=1 Tax=Comamonas composti TaxID=408558 RepID=UPI0012EC3E09|nr:hypothetical protein [Comamonas composti]
MFTIFSAAVLQDISYARIILWTLSSMAAMKIFNRKQLVQKIQYTNNKSNYKKLLIEKLEASTSLPSPLSNQETP